MIKQRYSIIKVINNLIFFTFIILFPIQIIAQKKDNQLTLKEQQVIIDSINSKLQAIYIVLFF